VVLLFLATVTNCITLAPRIVKFHDARPTTGFQLKHFIIGHFNSLDCLSHPCFIFRILAILQREVASVPTDFLDYCCWNFHVSYSPLPSYTGLIILPIVFSTLLQHLIPYILQHFTCASAAILTTYSHGACTRIFTLTTIIRWPRLAQLPRRRVSMTMMWSREVQMTTWLKLRHNT
jgi:hypothetical protein